MSIGPYEAWTLSRIMVGQSISADGLARVSPAWRPLAATLAAVEPNERVPMLRGYSLHLPDPVGLSRAIADQDPDGPPPDPQTDPTEAGDPRPSVRLTRASEIESREVEWLWPKRTPLGMLSLWSGDPKLGKSLASMWLAGAASRGAPGWHGQILGPASVIIMSAEDDAARTIVPRLKAAGADLSRIHVLESVILSDGSEALPSLRTDMDAIQAAAASLDDCRLIIIDPISAYLGGTDDHRNAELRGVLSPLKRMAERLNLAVVLVTHHSKSGGVNGKHRVIGSVAYVGACRANFLFVKDKDDTTGRRVLMLDNGGNLAPTQPGLAYIIEDRGNGPAVEWFQETIDKDADTVLRELAEAQAEMGDPAKAAIRRECDEWLREALVPGPMAVKEILRLGKEAGFSEHQVKRARVSIDAKSARHGFGPDATYHWYLGAASPGHAETMERTFDHGAQTL